MESPDRLRIYLRSPLFAVRKSPHLPPTAVILEGQVVARGDGGLTVRVSAWADEQGQPLPGAGQLIFLPISKIDHAVVLEEA
jgi:hypothetical protein